MQFRTPRRRSENLLDITPIVDTVFNLLIFFALSLNFISAPGIQVRLPQATGEEVAQERTALRVGINAAGAFYLDEKRVRPEELAAAFRAAAAARRDTQVWIRADENARHGQVVEVMDLARTAGLHRLAILTQPKPERSR
jgi:biopolymer transport protein ExbD